MNHLCARCDSQIHTRGEHDERECINVNGSRNAKGPTRGQKMSLAQTHWSGAGVRQEVCWRLVGQRPGIPEINDKIIREPWVQPESPQQKICRQYERCPCLSCEGKRKQKFDRAQARRMVRMD